MKYKTKYTFRLSIIILVLIISIQPSFAVKKKKKLKKIITTTVAKDSVYRKVIPFDLAPPAFTSNSTIINTDDLIWFAKQQLGTPYKYASADPKNGGLDCSGFLYYVFTHYKIKVPRSSKDYMSYGTTVDKNDAQKGDVIVFTGTNAAQRIGGHVGLVLENYNGEITFIHGSSGKANGVTISKLSEGYYTQRFLKVVRIL